MSKAGDIKSAVRQSEKIILTHIQSTVQNELTKLSHDTGLTLGPIAIEITTAGYMSSDKPSIIVTGLTIGHEL